MSGNAENTALWANADVYVSWDAAPAMPTDVTTPLGVGWELAGLLDGAEGFTEARESESSEKYAWGGILYKRTSSKHKRTFKFVALEDNDVTFRLVNPGSTRTEAAGLRTSQVKAPVAGDRFAIVFETREGDVTRRRVVASAEVVEVDEIKDSEEEPTVYGITVLVFPSGAENVLYTDLQNDPNYVATP
jgi:hypothetical protein